MDVKHKKTLKEYYADPEYRKKHIDKYKQKVECSCGSMVTLYNMSHHKKSKKHLKLNETDEERIKRMETELKTLKSKLKTKNDEK